jgi:predicted ester cyclase
MGYSAGAVELPIANDTPEPIRVLLTETCVNANGKIVRTDRTAHFQQYIRSYNNSVAFTSLGAKLNRVITDTVNTAGVYTFRIRGALHHSMGGLLPPPGDRLRFAQVYLYDIAEEHSVMVASWIVNITGCCLHRGLFMSLWIVASVVGHC